MEFPAYVPEPVKAQITTLIDDEEGWGAELASTKKKLVEIDRAIEVEIQSGGIEYPDSLRNQKFKIEKERDLFKNLVDILERLAHDPRMKTAYVKLTPEITEDKQWKAFIYAALGASQDYSKYRVQLKQAKDLRDQVASTSEKLAGLLRKAEGLGLYFPPEFSSISILLQRTDNHEMNGRNAVMWRMMRRQVFGNLPNNLEGEEAQEESDSASTPTVIFNDPLSGEGPEIDPKNPLGLGWDMAPPLSAVLDTVTKAAREFTPTSESEMVEAAIQSRQKSKSENKEYLRAFGSLMFEGGHGATKTINVMNAMAIIATVVINDPDFVVTYDDVIKAIGKTVETRP